MATACKRQSVVLNIYRDGKQRGVAVDCRNWMCDKCASDKLVEIGDHLMVVTVSAVVWTVLASKRNAGAIRDRATREKANTLRMSLEDEGLFLVSDVELRGRGWKTREMLVRDVVFQLANWLNDGRTRPTRIDWSKPWSLPSPERRPVYFRWKFPSVAAMEEALDEAGIDAFKEDVPDPEAAAARLRALVEPGEEPVVRVRGRSTWRPRTRST